MMINLKNISMLRQDFFKEAWLVSGKKSSNDVEAKGLDKIKTKKSTKELLIDIAKKKSTQMNHWRCLEFRHLNQLRAQSMR